MINTIKEISASYALVNPVELELRTQKLQKFLKSNDFLKIDVLQ